MKQRFISGIIGAIILIVVLISPEIVLSIAVCIVVGIAVNELYDVINVGGNVPLRVSGMLFSLVLTVCIAYIPELTMPVIYLFVVMLFMMYMTKSYRLGFRDISKAFFPVVFISYFFSHLIFIRCSENGSFLIWMVFVISFLTDTFAYIIGSNVGKHKLSKRISPKKTIEGSVAGLVGAVLGIVAFVVVTEQLFKIPCNFNNALIIAVICSAISQFGDLAASSIKRQYGIKDYGHIMPGHGGIMDRFDGVIFVAPALYYLMQLLPVIK